MLILPAWLDTDEATAAIAAMTILLNLENAGASLSPVGLKKWRLLFTAKPPQSDISKAPDLSACSASEPADWFLCWRAGFEPAFTPLCRIADGDQPASLLHQQIKGIGAYLDLGYCSQALSGLSSDSKTTLLLRVILPELTGVPLSVDAGSKISMHRFPRRCNHRCCLDQGSFEGNTQDLEILAFR